MQTRSEFFENLRKQLGNQKYQELLDSLGGEDKVWETWINVSNKYSPSNSTGIETSYAKARSTPHEQVNPFVAALPITASIALAGVGYTIYWIMMAIGRTLLWLASFGSLNYGVHEWGDEAFEPGTGCNVTAMILGALCNAVAFGPTWILLSMAAYILGVIYFLISNYVEEHGWSWLPKAAIVLGCLVGGYLIWQVGPWMIESVKLWWNWLGTYF